MASQNEMAFRRWWWIVPIAIAIGLAGAFGALQVVAPQYEATCRLFVSVPPNTGPGESYQAAQFGQARVAAYLDLIKGDRVARQAIDALDLDLPVDDLKQRITAAADAESVVMNVSVVDMQTQRAADLANAVCNAFLAVAADAEGPNPPIIVRMIENAGPTLDPISPIGKKYLAVGGLAGFLAGVGLVLLLSRLNLREAARTGLAGDSRRDLVSRGRLSDDPKSVADDEADESGARHLKGQ